MLRRIARLSLFFIWLLLASIFFAFSISYLVEYFSFIHSIQLSKVMNQYSSIINYLLNPFWDKLSIEGYTLTKAGYEHFCEVKTMLQISFGVLLVLTVYLKQLLAKAYREHTLYQLLGFEILYILPLPIVSLVLTNFDYYFVLFHKIIFNNNNWIFDVKFDSVITIMPVSLFLTCFCLGLVMYEILVYLLERSIKRGMRNGI